ncbi:glycoside hydrolase family 27 protein [Kutzneria buriramensis]|uniref:Alpha-galactosidase n=1 Tax=Kutzneria buriramensis TaxID=1045776 RepID=A0A3E0HPI8_9PSEU|nr:glycoside hydrolase family 27 protein [Kutzneria buriramensis]REH48344.1 alpha galactosidase A [Kutzneria buriramensis]
MPSRLTVVAAVSVAVAVLLPGASPAYAKTGFATPAMGWSSWSVEASTRATYGTSWLTESHVEGAADAVASKLRSAGYRYIDIDSGWNADMSFHGHTDGNGIPDADSTRFPDGMAAVATYVHDEGLLLGLYTTVGLDKGVYDKNAPILGTGCHTQDIAQQPLTATNGWGSSWKIDYGNSCAQAYIDSIVNRFASWGVDLIKVDGTTADNVADIQAWSRAIDRSGRNMWLTTSAWPVPQSIESQLSGYTNDVRIDTDVECYCGTLATWSSSVSARWNDLPNWLAGLSPGYFPDLDSMPISNNSGSAIQDGISSTERQSVMTFWSMASAPLYVGGDVYFLDSGAVSILTNPEVVAVDQSARFPTRITGGTLQKWRKQLPDGSWAVAVYNLGSSSANITVNWGDLGIGGSHPVRDLASRTDLGSFNGSWTATGVPAHGSRLIKVG